MRHRRRFFLGRVPATGMTDDSMRVAAVAGRATR